MKIIKTGVLVVFVGITPSINAQFLKKLMKKAEKAAEKTIEKKVEEKTTRETDKAFDDTFNKKKSNKASEKSNSPANTYEFSHKYVMRVKNKRRTTDLEYYLTKSGNYFASKMPNDKNNTTTVMDIDKKTMFMFMDSKRDKTLMAMSLNFEKLTDDAIQESNVQITPTGNTKTIVNYPCEEYKVKGDDFHGTVWVTKKAGIHFVKSFYKIKNKRSVNQSWMTMIDGLSMEMNITDTSKRRPKKITMTCIALEKQPLKINSKQYKKLF